MTRNELFFDTNVIVYIGSSDAIKAERAEATVAAGGVISVQVLTEFADVTARKLRVPWPRVRQFLTRFQATVTVVPVTLETHELAVAIAERYRFRIYDAQLLAAALLAGCTTFYSEDLHDGQVIENTLTIRNPFA